MRTTALTLVIGLAAVGVLGCEGGSPTALTGPSTTAGEGSPPTVTGARAAEGQRVVAAAWPRVVARYPGADLSGWTAEWVETLIIRPNAICGTAPCGPRPLAGVTDPRARRITLTWTMAPHRYEAVAAWELCNAVHLQGDRGCA